MNKLLICLFTFLFISQLTPSLAESPPTSDKKKLGHEVLVTLAPYTYLVKRISNDTISAQTLVPLNADPHIFEPTPKQIEEISSTKLWFRLGESIEKKILGVLKQRTPSLKTANLWEGIPLIAMSETTEGHAHCHHTHTHTEHCSHSSSKLGEEEDKDLHIWLSPKLAMQQARMVADYLTQLYPDNKALYTDGLNKLLIDLKMLDQEIAVLLAPFKGQAILVSHPAFGYFCKDYGLIQLSIESDGKDPLPQTITQTLDLAKKLHVRSVFIQAQHNNKGAQLVAKKLKLPAYTVDPYSSDLIENMRSLAYLIAKRDSTHND